MTTQWRVYAQIEAPEAKEGARVILPDAKPKCPTVAVRKEAGMPIAARFGARM
jgi:hypothetical protein